MTIYSVAVNQPRIHAIVAKDGAVNWDIAKPDTTATTAYRIKTIQSWN